MYKTIKASKKSFFTIVKEDFIKNRSLYLIVLPVLLFYAVFHYSPMYGASIAFKDFSPMKGIIGSDWVGFKHFIDFFTSVNCKQLILNTLTISVLNIIFSFPMPIIFALALNELRSAKISNTVKTVSYFPHFISLVVVCAMVKMFIAPEGFIGNIYTKLTGDPSNIIDNPRYFVAIYIASGIWQNMGWNSIIYVAALAGVDVQLYEAAEIDGCGRWRKIWNITLPEISSTIIILLILQLGTLLSVGYEKIILLYNPLNYEASDVISTYVYRKGLQEFDYSFSTAVGLFNSAINFLLLIVVNKISKKVSDIGIM